MADSTRFTRVTDPADPYRCQAIGARGNQCNMVAVEGQTNCPMHSGMGNAVAVKEEIRNFRLLQWQIRVNEFADNDKVKSLREEIGITRMLLEEVINRCGNATELILYSGKITDLVTKIEKLVTSCHRLEERTGMLLDKSAAIVLAGKMVDIITKHVADANAIDLISGEIIDAIADTHSLPKELKG